MDDDLTTVAFWILLLICAVLGTWFLGKGLAAWLVSQLVSLV